MVKLVIISGLRMIIELILDSRYTETLERIEKYAKALISHDLFAVTDGTVKRSDGKPVDS